MRIGFVKYINALPLHLYFPFQDQLIFDIPTQLNQMLRQGGLDAALTSCTAYLDYGYSHLPGFCIAAHKQILSVNLYLKSDLKNADIGTTGHSAAAASLLQVLCLLWKVKPSFSVLDPSKPLETYDGFLLIGDEALEKRVIPGYKTIDLAAEWYKLTQLPFVFALFSITDNTDISSLDLLASAFDQALCRSESNASKLIEAAQKKTGFSSELIDRYYKLCHYRLGEKELEGLKLFRELRKDVSRFFA